VTQVELALAGAAWQYHASWRQLKAQLSAMALASFSCSQLSG